MMEPRRVVILGAAGRDFHDFNTCFRGRPNLRVLAFTAAQIPGIAGRRYPASLAGEGYPEGIPIIAEDRLEELIAAHDVEEVVFSYSDVSHEHVMHLASRALAAGASFSLLGPRRTQLHSKKPVVAVCAARTGCGKSQTARWIAQRLVDAGKRVAAIRHPMPYGDLAAQAVQRFADYEDLERHACTIEEREEYEAYLEAGLTIYAGVDYRQILTQAEQEADVVLWDGGNNDLPFLAADLHLTVVDPLRADHVERYHPGEANVRAAHVLLVNKADQAERPALEALRATLARLNPTATVLEAASPVRLDDAAAVAGKRVVVVDDGPTLTHGEMAYGAGYVAAQAAGAEVVDPRPHAQGDLRAVFARFPHLGPVVPAMGYGEEQRRDLAATLAATPADVVVAGTPIDLGRLLGLDKACVRARYSLEPRGEPDLGQLVLERLFDR
jgi:predicted GTPase